MSRLLETEFKKWALMDNGMKPLFIQGVAEEVQSRFLSLVRAGYLSDPPGFAMYYEVNHKPGSELLTWRAIRGNSPLERCVNKP